jgi:hypothetical protein
VASRGGSGRCLAAVLLLGLSPFGAPFGAGLVPSAAQSAGADGKELLRSEFWTELSPVAGVGDEWPVSPETARSRILDEAAWVFGGMIWGFEFRYTPYDKTRALAERFDLEPIQSLAPSDPKPAAGARARSGDMLYLVAEYRPDPDLVALMGSYAQGPYKGAQGIGKADMNRGVKGKREAYADGLRAAVRSLLQGLEPNKPRLVRGRAVFDRPPSMAIIGGFYTAQVRARVMVVETIPYKVY